MWVRCIQALIPHFDLAEALLAVLASHIRVLACLLNIPHIPHGGGLVVEFLILTPRIHMD